MLQDKLFKDLIKEQKFLMCIPTLDGSTYPLTADAFSIVIPVKHELEIDVMAKYKTLRTCMMNRLTPPPFITTAAFNNVFYIHVRLSFILSHQTYSIAVCLIFD
jgi:hypothetical protein